MRRLFCALLCLAVLQQFYAQDVSSCSDEIFRLKMKDLVSQGNLFYENSNRFGIRQITDSMACLLKQRCRIGNLSRMDSLEFRADWYKLLGSYHYENSYYDSTSYAMAHKNYQEALKIYRNETAFEGDLQCEPMIQRELAQLYYKEGNYQEAFNHTKASYDAFENAANLGEIDDDDPDYLDIQTQMAICQARMGNTNEALAKMDKLIGGFEKTDFRYGEALRKKAKILMLQEENGGKASGKSALECYKEYFSLKKDDALTHFMKMSSMEREQYWMRIRSFITDCYRLEDTDAGFLYDVTLFAKGLLLQLDSAGGGKQNIHATWQTIQKMLHPDDCAIEFVQYEKYGKQQMGALVLKENGSPVFVKMVSPDSLLKYRLGEYSVEERLNKTDLNSYHAIDRIYNDSTGLYQMIWNKQLVATIGHLKNVYFAPDGYIHRVAIEYMLPEEVAHWRLYRLSSTRSLLSMPHFSANDKALIIGDIDYNKVSEYAKGNNDTMAYQAMEGLSFRNISESKDEINAILRFRHNSSDVIIRKDSASENEFRKLCKGYPIIHISTHGKYMAKSTPFGTEIKACLTDETLSENIIAFAGMNKALQDENFNPQVMQDGILSAKEISSLDMSDTQLVVLACCESGLGQVSADGVYGIQRGLKNAGAKAIVMSLWEAESNFTSRFMISFHQKLVKGVSISEAFRQAREEFIDTEEPSIRNVFILIDAIE